MEEREANLTSMDLLGMGQTVTFHSSPASAKTLITGRVDGIDNNRLTVKPTSDISSLDPGQILNNEINMRWDATGSRNECPVLVEKMSPEALILTPRLQEKREFLRIKVSLPMDYEVISADEFQDVKRKILSGEALTGSLEIEASRFWHGADLGEKLDDQFSQISQLFKQVDAKLDYLIALGEGKQPVLKGAHSVSLLDISGAGLGFVHQNAIPLETYLKICIQLDRFPLVEIAALCQVTRCMPIEEEPSQGRHDIGIHFIAMHKDSRERIFHFISRVERKMLRERKEAMNP